MNLEMISKNIKYDILKFWRIWHIRSCNYNNEFIVSSSAISVFGKPTYFCRSDMSSINIVFEI